MRAFALIDRGHRFFRRTLSPLGDSSQLQLISRLVVFVQVRTVVHAFQVSRLHHSMDGNARFADELFDKIAAVNALNNNAVEVSVAVAACTHNKASLALFPNRPTALTVSFPGGGKCRRGRRSLSELLLTMTRTHSPVSALPAVGNNNCQQRKNSERTSSVLDDYMPSLTIITPHSNAKTRSPTTEMNRLQMDASQSWAKGLLQRWEEATHENNLLRAKVESLKRCERVLSEQEMRLESLVHFCFFILYFSFLLQHKDKEQAENEHRRQLQLAYGKLHKLQERLKHSERLCDEALVENRQLRNNAHTIASMFSPQNTPNQRGAQRARACCGEWLP